MPKIFKQSDIEFSELQKAPKPFDWFSSPRLSEIGNSKFLFFNLRKLDPGKYSFPYHFHHNSEELFIILEGSSTLRAPEGLQIVFKGDIVFMELGETSAHQLYNHTSEPCVYFDLRTNNGLDVTEYPDSNKTNISPYRLIFDKTTQVDYFKGEENIEDVWKKLTNKK